jgi:hypothetical protein
MSGEKRKSANLKMSYNFKMVCKALILVDGLVGKGAFPPSHFCNKLDGKLARKVALVSL